MEKAAKNLRGGNNKKLSLKTTKKGKEVFLKG